MKTCGRKYKLLLSFVLLLGVSEWTIRDSMASGFERNILSSGKNAGFGGAAVSAVRGSESLLFNPAGISGVRDYDVSINISPGSQMNGAPHSVSGHVERSGGVFQIPFTGFVSYGIGDIGGGFGVADVGSNRIVFDDVVFVENSALRAKTESDLNFLEYSFGMSYRIVRGLRVGAAWRITHLSGHLTTSTPHASGFTQNEFSNFSGIDLGGYRVGFQYDDFIDGWGLGASFRNRADITAEGKLKAKINNSVMGEESDTQMLITLPNELKVGIHFPFLMETNMRLEYGWTQYNSVQNLDFQKPGQIDSVFQGDVSTHFSAQTQLRIGVGKDEVIGNWAVRGGYVYTSPVVPKEFARTIFFPPASIHSITLGTGARVDEGLNLNITLEYSFGAGDGEIQGLSEVIMREYSYKAVNVHSGITYRF